MALKVGVRESRSGTPEVVSAPDASSSFSMGSPSSRVKSQKPFCSKGRAWLKVSRDVRNQRGHMVGMPRRPGQEGAIRRAQPVSAPILSALSQPPSQHQGLGFCMCWHHVPHPSLGHKQQREGMWAARRHLAG